MPRFRLLEIEKGQLNKSNLDNINPCYFEVLQGHDLVVYQLYIDLQAISYYMFFWQAHESNSRFMFFINSMYQHALLASLV